MRNKRLDILRCVAIFLVLFQHGQIGLLSSRAGWVGVDLFFVLSGFLISGLLFDEYRKNGAIQFKRFFIRRAFKIYPAFYFFLASTALLEFYRHNFSSLAKYLHEFFFVQSYAPGIWAYTWSLAVEEHFYIFLPLLLFVLLRFASNIQDPFRAIPAVFLAVAVLCQLARTASQFAAPPDYYLVYHATHNRVDSLFFGVLLGYLHHFRPEYLDRLMRPGRNRWLVFTLSVALLSSACWFDREGWFFGVIGYALIYVGFGALLLASLYIYDILPNPLVAIVKPIGTAFAAIGVYSYSIYLWHGLVNAYFVGFTKRLLHVPLGRYQSFALALLESLVVGILMSKLVEYPALRLRNRLFPSPTAVAQYPNEAAFVSTVHELPARGD